jgi:hypothetical protein
MDTVILNKWLRCGFLENSNWFATEEGTPQGGIASPTLANWALDGLETLLRKTFPQSWKEGQNINPKVKLVRYAQYCSLNNSDSRTEVAAGRRLAGAWTQRITAHLALHPARIPPLATRYHPLLKNLLQNRLMKLHLLPRGE